MDQPSHARWECSRGNNRHDCEPWPERGFKMKLPSFLWECAIKTEQSHEAWNKSKLVGQKPPLSPKDVWPIRIHLQNAHAVRDVTLFNLAIDSKLRGCDLVSLRVRDVTHVNQVLPGHRSFSERRSAPFSWS